MEARSIILPRADWVGLVEAIHAHADTDQIWAENVAAAATEVFAPGRVTGIYTLEHPPDLSDLSMPIAAPVAAASLVTTMVDFSRKHGPQMWAPFHFHPTPVVTHREIAAILDTGLSGEVDELQSKQSFGDAVALVVHPRPGLVTVLTSAYEEPVALDVRDRDKLARIARHLDAAHRLRQRPAEIVAELSSSGELLERTEGAPATARMKAEGAKIRAARSRDARASGQGLDLWTALVDGRVSIVPRGTGKSARYLVLTNPPSNHQLNALTPAEVSVVALAARGVSTKLIAYGLGLSSSAVSARLASASRKMGTLTHGELLRIAALLAHDPRAGAPDDALTAAESDVLALLQRGLSNVRIAKLRSRSIRTIANQVASILKKTHSASRRALIAR